MRVRNLKLKEASCADEKHLGRVISSLAQANKGRHRNLEKEEGERLQN